MTAQEAIAYQLKTNERAFRIAAEQRVAARLAEISADVTGPRREALERCIRQQADERFAQQMAECRRRLGVA